jgi:hypothetical protein
MFLFNRGARESYVSAVAARAASLAERFRAAGWRAGTLDERDGRASLERVFGLR